MIRAQRAQTLRAIREHAIGSGLAHPLDLRVRHRFDLTAFQDALHGRPQLTIRRGDGFGSTIAPITADRAKPWRLRMPNTSSSADCAQAISRPPLFCKEAATTEIYAWTLVGNTTADRQASQF